jgi:hypothetical protein
MHCVSDWYPDLSEFTFPTVFLRLDEAQKAALIKGDTGDAGESVIRRLQAAIKALPGSCFAHADYCSPTDSPILERNKGAVKSGRKAWEILTTSDKVRAALEAGKTERLAVHPYRRMDRVREFRLFIYGGELKAISQKCLERHFARLEGRRTPIWKKGQILAAQIAPYLPDNIVVDVYLTSAGHYMIMSTKQWGEPTAPLLLRKWDRDWSEEVGLRLIDKPVQMKGDVEVSF